MERKEFRKTVAGLIAVIFVLNFLANKFYWYYSIWYFDMIMHFLGGLWVALAYLYLVSATDINQRLVWKTLGAVLLIGVGWEIFEFYFINHVAENPFDQVDTLSDLFFDLLGGSGAIIYFKNKILTYDN